MRSIGSLLDKGYELRPNTDLYLKNESIAHIKFTRWIHKTGRPREAVTRPFNRTFNASVLYLHPYFPEKPIRSVKILKPFPYARKLFTYEVNKGILHLSPKIAFTEDDIYSYPTFFKPIYD